MEVYPCQRCGELTSNDLCDECEKRVDYAQVVHGSDFAQQPDVRIACTQKWGTPAWGKQDPSLPPGVFKLDSGERYSFDSYKVTCPDCKKVLPA